MSKTHRSYVPPAGGPMRAKQVKRRQTRAALEADWLDEYEQEQQERLDELAALDEMMLGYQQGDDNDK